MVDRQKILFVQKINKNEFETESIWCLKDGDFYIVDNIPFIAKRISLGDTIEAEYDSDEKAYYFADFIKVSGNTTVRLYFEDINNISSTRKELEKLGCEGEIFLARKLLAVNINRDLKYAPIKDFLDKGEENGLWTYEESYLAHKY